MTTDTDAHDDTTHLVTRRRAFIAAIVVGGVGLASASSHDPPRDVGLGGGPMADAHADKIAELYRWDESTLPDPGVIGRYLQLQTDAGGFDAGTLLEDTGDAWEPVVTPLAHVGVPEVSG